jgi:signal transduction histidine kinase
MLHEFLIANRCTLITRCRAKVAKRTEPRPSDAELQHGIPLFLEQLVRALQLEQSSTSTERHPSAVLAGSRGTPDASEIGKTAAKHGNELLRHGFTVDQVVHDYGDLCQAITELAVEREAPVTTEEFRTLNRCLDNAIANAVTEFGRQREALISGKGARAMSERLGSLAHELRNLLNSAMLAVEAIKRGEVGLAGATGAVLDRSHMGLRDLIERVLDEVRLALPAPAQRERIGLPEFIAEVQVAGVLEAKTRDCALTVSPVEDGLAVDADRQMLWSAVANLLQNAFKFSRRHGQVSLSVYRSPGNRVLIEIEDECGGLGQDAPKKLFLPFAQLGRDRSGLGLGLSVARRSIEANGGTVHVRDLPGTGCVFTIDLPLAREEPAD